MAGNKFKEEIPENIKVELSCFIRKVTLTKP